jgi:hypothetical protein
MAAVTWVVWELWPVCRLGGWRIFARWRHGEASTYEIARLARDSPCSDFSGKDGTQGSRGVEQVSRTQMRMQVFI